MKKTFYLFVVLFFVSSCSPKKQEKPKKKLYIFSTSNKCVEVDWYCYSSIGGFPTGKIEFRKRATNDTITTEGYYISDIQIVNDTLKLQLWSKDTSGIDIPQIPCFKNIQITTNGDQNKNGIEARISRIIKAGVDYTKPHTFNSKAE